MRDRRRGWRWSDDRRQRLQASAPARAKPSAGDAACGTRQAHRVSPGGPAAGVGGSRRPDPGRHARPAGGGGELHRRPRREFRDLRGHPHPRRDARRAAQARLGAALGASQGARGGSGDARDRGGVRARGARHRGRHEDGRDRWTSTTRSPQDAAGCRIASLDDSSGEDESTAEPDRGRERGSVPRRRRREISERAQRKRSRSCRSASGW